MARHRGSQSSTPQSSKRRVDTQAALMQALSAALAFVPRERGEAMMRKWLHSVDPRALPESVQARVVQNALLLSADLVLSQPSVSGATAFDRLAKSPAGAAVDATAIAALRRARFRWLRLDASGLTAQDRLDGAMLRIGGPALPPLLGPVDVFARVAVMDDGVCHLAGQITPLDAVAARLVDGHAAARAAGAAANARWAEAVYAHIVRYGTMDVPGLNLPDDDGPDDVFADDDNPVLLVARAWAALAGASADAALLERTRQLTALPCILDGFAGMAIARNAGHAELAAGFERVLLVLLETVLRRQASSVGGLTLERVAQAIEQQVAEQVLPADTPARLAALRQRLVGAADRGAGDAELARLVQRIQGLRAKTIAQGCTEQEALAAAAKVAELLDRYGLSLGELDFRAQPCDGIAVQTDRRRMGPIDNCIPAIAAFFDCRVWAERAQGEALRYVFFGLRADVTAAEYLYEMVERAFESETNSFRAGAIYAAMQGERRSATHSFQIGLASGIADKLRTLLAARSRRAGSGRDLVAAKAVMVDDEIAKLGLDFHAHVRSAGRRLLSEAFVAGQQAGERFEVVAGIAGGA